MDLEEVKSDGLESEGFLKMEVIFEVRKGDKTVREREAERKMLCVLLLTFTNSSGTSAALALCSSRLPCLPIVSSKR